MLTVLPKSWSVKKVQQEFGFSKVVEERGILSIVLIVLDPRRPYNE